MPGGGERAARHPDIKNVLFGCAYIALGLLFASGALDWWFQGTTQPYKTYLVVFLFLGGGVILLMEHAETKLNGETE